MDHNQLKSNDSPMTSWTNKVQTNMDASVMKSGKLTLDFQLLLKVAFKLRINVIHLIVK